MTKEAMPVRHLRDHGRKGSVGIHEIGITFERSLRRGWAEDRTIGCDKSVPRCVVTVGAWADEKRNDVNVFGAAPLRHFNVLAKAAGVPLETFSDSETDELLP